MQAAPTEIRTRPVPRCLLCGSVGGILYQDLADRFFDAPGRWQLKQCPKTSCGLLWLDPAPVDEDLHLAYQTYFTHAGDSVETTFIARVRSLLYRVYWAAQYVPNALTGLGESKKQLSRMYLDDLPPGKLLDVGCGAGVFLNRMRERGWSVDGVDSDAKALAYVKEKYGLELHCGDLKSARFADNSFDAITMSHVIEHLPAPAGMLAEIRRILKPGGRLVVTTPNSVSIGHKKFQAYWMGVDAPRHLIIYSPATLSEWARQGGFKVLRAFSTAARADIFIGGSFSIRDAPGHRTTSNPGLDPARIWNTISLQYREHARLRAEPECGEEAVLLCVKEPS